MHLNGQRKVTGKGDSMCQEILLFFCLLSTSYLATGKMASDSSEH